jgi:hypothetical protein
MKSCQFLRLVPRIAQRARGQSLRFASSQATPHVDEIEFEMLGDPTTASYPSMPFPTETREQLEQGIATKAQELTKQWESKFSSKSDLNAVLAKDVLEFKPNDEKALQEELKSVENPTIQATDDTAFNTKDHNFLTNFLTSRIASYLDDPVLYFSYGEHPSAAFKSNWAEILQKNSTTIKSLGALETLSEKSAEYQEIVRLQRQIKAQEAKTLQTIQDDIEKFSDPAHIAMTFANAGLSPDLMNHLVDIVSTKPVDEKLLALLKKQIAEREHYDKESVSAMHLEEFATLSRELAKHFEASGVSFDYSKISF